MAKSWSSRHDGRLVDGHSIFGVVGNDGVTRLMIGCDGLVFLVYYNTFPLRAWNDKLSGIKG